MSINPIDRMYDALAEGDVPAMRACFTADARIWHSFDGIAQEIDAAAQAWGGLVAYSEERILADVRRLPTADGFVQQHVFVARIGGERKAWPVCLVVRIKGDLIARIDEYMDRAGSFVAADGAVHTPGF